MNQKTSALQQRLLSCLETILGLERDLKKLEQGQVLLAEFNQLKSFMEKIDQVMLDEYEVNRIEKATANFLEEIKGPLGMLSQGPRQNKLLQ